MSESTEVTRSFITDEWMAKAVKLGSLQELAGQFFTDFGFDVFDTERDGIFQPELIKDKDRLIEREFFITRWRTHESDKYTNKETGEAGFFSVIELVYTKTVKDENGRGVDVLAPAVFTDGGVGVAKTLDEVTRRRMQYNGTAEGKKKPVDPFGGLPVLGGLTKSEYDTVINGESVHGVTFYLNFTPQA